MTTPVGSSDAVARSFLERRFQRLWLALLFIAGLGFTILTPPFHAIDEVWHWDRLWTVAQGQYSCKTLPNAAAQFAMQTYPGPEPEQPVVLPFSLIEKAYEFVGHPKGFFVATAACGYPPIGYVPAAIAIRILNPTDLLEPRPHKMFYALYGGRLANWLVFFASVVLALRMSAYPLPVMMFASIPMVVQQSAVLNNDAVQFGALLVAGALLTRSPTRRNLWGAIVMIALASWIKPIDAILSVLVWIKVWSAARVGTFRRNEALLTAFGALALPVGAWLSWHHTMELPILGATTTIPVVNVNESAQRELLKAEPLRVLRMLGWQFKQLFVAAPIDGGWRGILLVLGWCRYVAPFYVYALVLGALASGIALLRHGGPERTRDDARVPPLLILAAIGALVSYFGVVTYALYLGFTPVGHEGVYGVQGRYFLYAIGMVLFLYPIAKRGKQLLTGRSAERCGWAFLALSVAGNLSGVYAVLQIFWGF